MLILRKPFAIVFSLVIMMAVTASAEGTIKVEGKSSVKFAPDEVTITVVVENFDDNLTTARLQTDKQVAGILSVVQDYNVKPGHVQTSHLNINKSYENYQKKDKVEGYRIAKTISITITDMSQFDKIITDILGLGAEQIFNMKFKSSRFHEYRKEAVTLAVRSAKDKATAMIAELGKSLGEPVNITENYAELVDNNPMPLSSRYRFMDDGLMMGGAFNAVSSHGENQSYGTASMASGQLVINASVTVEFLIE